MGARGAITTFAPATVVDGAAVVDEGSGAGGAWVVVVTTVVVVDVVVDVVEVVVVDVVGVGTRGAFGVTATLLRGPLAAATTATIQQREAGGGLTGSTVSVRPDGEMETADRSILMTVSTGFFKLSASSESASFSSSSCP